jgi:hypothetical protein
MNRCGKRRLDLRRSPPDLAIEVDATPSSLDRMKIYAARACPRFGNRWRRTHLQVLNRAPLRRESDQSGVSADPPAT